MGGSKGGTQTSITEPPAWQVPYLKGGMEFANRLYTGGNALRLGNDTGAIIGPATGPPTMPMPYGPIQGQPFDYTGGQYPYGTGSWWPQPPAQPPPQTLGEVWSGSPGPLQQPSAPGGLQFTSSAAQPQQLTSAASKSTPGTVTPTGTTPNTATPGPPPLPGAPLLGTGWIGSIPGVREQLDAHSWMGDIPGIANPPNWRELVRPTPPDFYNPGTPPTGTTPPPTGGVAPPTGGTNPPNANELAILLQNAPQYFPWETLAQTNPLTSLAQQFTAQRAMTGSPVENMGAQNLYNTLSGAYMMPGANPFLDATFGTMADQLRGQLSAQFNQAGMLNSTPNQGMLQTGLSTLANQVYGQNYAQERQNQMQALGLAPTYGALDYKNLQALQGVGAQQQAQEQAKINDAMQRWNYYQNLPYTQLADYMQQVQGNYGGITQSSMNPSLASQIMGGLGTGLLGLMALGPGGLGLFGGAAAAEAPVLATA